MHLAYLKVIAGSHRHKRRQWVRLTRAGIPIRAKNFLSQLSRNAYVRPERIANSLSVQTSRKGINNAGGEQALQRAGRVIGGDQVQVRFEQRMQ